MYYDLKFPFKIKEGCKLGTQEDGEQLPVYTQLTMENCKKPIDEKEYSEMHERMRQQVADLVHEDVEMVVCISGEEYEANVDSEDDDSDPITMDETDGYES